MRGVLLSSLAEDDLAEILAYYELAKPGLGSEFMFEFKKFLSRVAQNPRQYSRFRTGRKGILNRFPYAVIYRFDADTIQVVGVAHGRRNVRLMARRLRKKPG